MGEREKERPCGVQPRVAEGLSDEELAQIFSRSSWTKQEVAAVLREQRRSGRSIMDFAALHGSSRSLQGTLPMPHGLCYPRGPVLAAMAWTALTSTAAAAARPGGSAASCG